MQNTYLSIDLDFWNESDIKSAKKLLKSVKRLGIEVCNVESHHKILPDINEAGCDVIINVDYHSDITNDFFYDPISKKIDVRHDELELNCGTWGNFVINRNFATYIWIYPLSDKKINRGYCHDATFKEHNPFLSPSMSNWKETKKIYTKDPLTHINLSEVKKIGLAWSLDYTRNKEALKIAYQLFGPPKCHDKKVEKKVNKLIRSNFKDMEKRN